MAEHLFYTEGVAGSNPAASTMLLVYPSVTHQAPRGLKNFSSIKTLVGIESQLHEWPHSTLGPGYCNDVLETTNKIVEVAKSSTIKTIVPLVEKVVLACGLAVSKLRLSQGFRLCGNTLETAIICTDRLSQRKALEKTRLNPNFLLSSDRNIKENLSNIKFPIVLKKPASARSEGVRIIYDGQELSRFNLNNWATTRQMYRLRQVGFKPDYNFLIEEFVEGENWEVDGISRGKVTHVFQPLKQTWSKAGEKIIKYEAAVPPPGLIDSAIKAVEASGIKWSGWCVELKGDVNNWKVIEVNARLGEDGGDFYNLLSPIIHPVEKLCQVLLE